MMKRLKDESEGSTMDGLVVDDGRRGVAAEAPGSAAFPIVGVGASAGGLEAFTQLLKQPPRRQRDGVRPHPAPRSRPTRASCAEALAKATTMPVSQAEDGTPVEPEPRLRHPARRGHRDHGRPLTLAPRRERRPRPHLPIDFFLRSLAAERGSHAIGVVLSGTASDGTEGLRAIKAEDGITFAQDPKSAKFGGMPRSAVDAGVVDYALPIPELAARARAPEPPPLRGGRRRARRRQAATPTSAPDLRASCATPSASTSASTSRRRSSGGWPAGWRCAGSRTCRTTWRCCKREPEEVRALYEDILIHVTSFFRDPEVFAALKTQRLPGDPQAQAGGGADSHLGRRLLDRRGGLLAGHRAARVPRRDLARTRFRSSARTSARRPSRRRAPASTRTARCATSATSGAAATSPRSTAATASTRRSAISACSSGTTSRATRRSRSSTS